MMSSMAVVTISRRNRETLRRERTNERRNIGELFTSEQRDPTKGENFRGTKVMIIKLQGM